MAESVHTAPVVSEKSRDTFRFLVPNWRAGILLILVAWLYGPILWRLGKEWTDPNFSHGIFVPLFALFVVWQEREKIVATQKSPSWTGVLILVCSMLMVALGVLGAELFFSRTSFLVLIAGLIVLFQGWPRFRAVLFPWAFLILMIPIPQLIFQQITFPLQLLASKLAAAILPVFTIPVLREGNIINLPHKSLEVVQACSGIRSLLSLITLAIVYGYFLDNRKWVRVVLAISAVPIAVAANSLRIVGTGLIVEWWDPSKADGFFHTLSGILVFVVSLAMLFLVHRMILRIWPEHKRSKLTISTRPLVHKKMRAIGSQEATARFLVTALIVGGSAIYLQAHARNEVFPARDPLVSIPAQFESWKGQDIAIDQQTLDILGPGEFLFRNYVSDNVEQPDVSLFVAYFPSQKTGDTVHSPSHCLPGSGYTFTQKRVVELAREDGSSFPANRNVASNGRERQLVLYWYQAHDREVASEYLAKYYLIRDSLHLHRSDGSLIRLMTPMLKGESPDAAQQRIMQIGSPLIPILNRYIPK